MLSSVSVDSQNISTKASFYSNICILVKIVFI